MTYRDIEQVFFRVRRAAGDPPLWLGRTFANLARDVDVMNPADQYGDESGDDPEPDEHLGEIGRPVVAWAYECEGPTLAVIRQGASEVGVEALFLRLAGVD